MPFLCFRAVSDKKHEQVRVMRGCFHAKMRAATYRVTKRTQELEKNGDRIRLCLRCDRSDDVIVCGFDFCHWSVLETLIGDGVQT